MNKKIIWFILVDGLCVLCAFYGGNLLDKFHNAHVPPPVGTITWKGNCARTKMDEGYYDTICDYKASNGVIFTAPASRYIIGDSIKKY